MQLLLATLVVVPYHSKIASIHFLFRELIRIYNLVRAGMLQSLKIEKLLLLPLSHHGWIPTRFFTLQSICVILLGI